MPSIRSSELWDVTKTEIPSRSRLVPIEPIGIGTADVESLTSYIARLAEAHAVTFGKLVDRGPSLLTPALSSNLSEVVRDRYRGQSINGMCDATRKWVHALEATTLRVDLAHLTLLSFEQLLFPRNLFRHGRAWCARCYEEARTAGAIIHDSLLWTIKLVVVCPCHELPLNERCPHCRRRVSWLTARFRPGYCSLCGSWLGMIANSTRASTCDSNEVWLARGVGELLAVGPQVQPESLGRTVRHNLRVYAEELLDGNLTALADSVGQNSRVLRAWLRGDQTICIDSLLRVCQKLKIPIASLVSPEYPNSDMLLQSAETIRLQPERSVRARPDPLQARHVLEEALHEEPAPSLREVARRLHYKSIGALYGIDRDLCKQISANYKRSRQGYEWANRGGVPLYEILSAQDILQEALGRDDPPSLRQLASSLGYTDRSWMYRKFPELCHAIIEKRRTRVTAALNRALQEDPPPSLADISRRLGYSDTLRLRRQAPDLCTELARRRKDYEHARLQVIQRKLEEARTEVPPPSLKTVQERLGLAVCTLRKHLPDLCKVIATNYKRHRQETVRRRRESLFLEVCEIMKRLRQTGVVPLGSSVKALLKSDSLKSWNTRQWAIAKARQALSGGSS